MSEATLPISEEIMTNARRNVQLVNECMELGHKIVKHMNHPLNGYKNFRLTVNSDGKAVCHYSKKDIV